jgi:hypothetical protein
MSFTGRRRYPADFSCWDGGVEVAGYDGSYCMDVRYHNEIDVYGATCASTSTITAGRISFDDVVVSAGNYTNYTANIPPDFTVEGKILAVDVTVIPLGLTSF